MDLAAIPASERRSLGVPGSSLGGTSRGESIGPASYDLPVTVQIAGLKSLEKDGLIVSLRIQSRHKFGDAVIRLPTCVDETKAHATGSLGRRTLEFKFQFSTAGRPRSTQTTAEVTFGSANHPECWAAISPGQSLLVIVRTRRPSDLLARPERQVPTQITAVLRELKLADSAFEISALSSEVRSKPFDLGLVD